MPPKISVKSTASAVMHKTWATGDGRCIMQSAGSTETIDGDQAFQLLLWQQTAARRRREDRLYALRGPRRAQAGLCFSQHHGRVAADAGAEQRSAVMGTGQRSGQCQNLEDVSKPLPQ